MRAPPPDMLAPPETPAHQAMRATISQLLRHWSDGERRVAEEVLPQVYAELHRIAAALFRRERRDHTLQATALVHEAYLRLIESRTRCSGRTATISTGWRPA